VTVSVLVGDTVGDGVSVNGIGVSVGVGDEVNVRVGVGVGGDGAKAYGIRATIIAKIPAITPVMIAPAMIGLAVIQLRIQFLAGSAAGAGTGSLEFALPEESTWLLIISPPHLVDDVHEW